MPPAAALAPALPDKRAKRGSGGKRPAPSPERILANVKSLGRLPKVGRPRSYTPDIAEEAIRMAADGASPASIAHAFGISRSTLSKWEADFPEFSDAMGRARVAAQHWWETKGQRSLGRKHFQAQVWAKTMSARFEDYREANNSNGANGLDLSELVGAISQGVAAATLQHGQPGDRAKVIEGQPVEDDASESTLPVVGKSR